MASIYDYFTPDSFSPGGGVGMLQVSEEVRKSFYLTNYNDEKLLKIIIKNEPHHKVEGTHAQIKIIAHGIKRAHIWKDEPSDPDIEVISDGVELTYHGSKLGSALPKVHMKARSGYKTLIDDSLGLPIGTDMPVPLFSMECGYKNSGKWGGLVTKRAHVASTGNPGNVRVDFYFCSGEMDVGAFYHSMYFFSMFSTQDYLLSKKNNPFDSGLIIAPILFFRVGGYMLILRRSLSSYQGRPYLSFYSNKKYYQKFSNRPVAYRSADGSLDWSTMGVEDERLRREYKAKKRGLKST